MYSSPLTSNRQWEQRRPVRDLAERFRKGLRQELIVSSWAHALLVPESELEAHRGLTPGQNQLVVLVEDSLRDRTTYV